MGRYKRHLHLGDYAITKRTARRYRLNQRDDAELKNFEEVNIEDNENSNINSNEQVYNDQDVEMFQEAVDSMDHLMKNEYSNTDASITDTNLGNYLRDELVKKLARTQSTPTNLPEFMESEDFSSMITTPVNKTVGELFLMILKFSIANSLSLTAITNLFKLVNSMFVEPILPDSRYVIDEILNPKCGIHFHAVCHNCSSYIGKFGEIGSVKSCDICNTDLDLSNPSNTSFFVIIDPSMQLADLLNIYGNHYNKIVNERQHEVV